MSNRRRRPRGHTWPRSAQPRWAVATPHVAEVQDRVDVVVDGEGHAEVAGPASQVVVEGEAVGEDVDLQGGAGADRSGHSL